LNTIHNSDLNDNQTFHLNTNFPQCSYEGSLREMVMLWVEDKHREDGSNLRIVHKDGEYTAFLFSRTSKPYQIAAPFDTEADAEEAYYQHCKKFALRDPDWFFYTEAEWQEVLDERALELL
jgi:hypothetical protein